MAERIEKTDPRFHAAYQRGYNGPEPEAATRAEQRFDRFRRASAGSETFAPRDRDRTKDERHSASVRAESPSEHALQLGTLTDETSALLVEDDVAGDAPERNQPSTVALDRRIPVALALLGVAFLAVGLGLLWVASSAMYADNGTEFEQFARAIMNFIPGPAVTIGLIAIGAAIALRAARS